MNFKQRLFRYLIGVVIGCILVFTIFPNYDWLGWTPGKQVMKRIRESKWEQTERGRCQMSCLNLNNGDFDQARFSGAINFSMSDAQSKPPRYQLEHEANVWQVLVSDSLITLLEVKKQGQSSDCDCK
jgi:hypothetical protein